MLRKFIVLLLSILGLGLYSQSFEGIVKSATDSVSLPYANIYIKGSTKGTVSNTDGMFKLYYPDSKDSVAISYVGAKTIELPIKTAIEQKIFYLQDQTAIKEVVVTKIRSGKTILKRAIDSLHINYPLNPTISSGYLKEVAFQDGSIGRMIEAAVQIWNPGYLIDSLEADKNNQMKLLNVKTDIDVLDPFRPSGSINSLTNRIFIDQNLWFITQHWDQYEYTLSENTVYDHVQAYVVEFKSKISFPVVGTDKIKALYKGSIIVATGSYSILKIDYKEKFLNSDKRGVLKRRSGDIQYVNKITSSSNETRYKLFNGKWYINFVKKSLSLKTTTLIKNPYQRTKKIRKTYKFRIEDTFIATDIKTQDAYPFDQDERVKINLPIIKQLGLSSNNIWDQFNAVSYTEKEKEFLSKNQ